MRGKVMRSTAGLNIFEILCCLVFVVNLILHLMEIIIFWAADQKAELSYAIVQKS